MRFQKKNRKKVWTGTIPLIIFITVCIYMFDSYGITKHTLLDAAVEAVQSNLGYQAARSCIPFVAYDASRTGKKTIYEYLAAGMDELLPIYGYAREQTTQLAMEESGLPREMAGEDSCDQNIDALTGNLLMQENQKETDAGSTQQGEEQAAGAERVLPETVLAAGDKAYKFSRQKLNDFDYLLQNFYRVDSTTTTNSEQLNAAKMLEKDMRIDKDQEGVQILIYHTHSQERFADSKDASQSVVGLGDVLTEILEDTYGYRVLHHKGVYDLPDRDSAYSRSGPALEKLLEQNPQIQVVIDLHRDAVAEGTRLVQKINGKDTASIMFFNGLSHTTAQGDIGYLYNPNLDDNLAFSFQMQLAAAEYYPGFSRCIYLRGYRYNLHYLPKSLLVETGAQTNTYQEAVNAMVPLADILHKVLSGEAG